MEKGGILMLSDSVNILINIRNRKAISKSKIDLKKK